MQEDEAGMNKVILITTNIAPYRLRWCEELSKYFDVTVYYSKDKEKDYNDGFLKHKSDKCHLVKMNNKDDNGEDPLCMDVLNIIKENKKSFIIFDGYGPKTNLLGLLYCKIKNIDNYVNVDGYPTERNKVFIKEVIKKFVIGNLCKNFFCGGEAVKDYLMSYGANKDNICVHNFTSITKDRIIKKILTKDEKLDLRKKYAIKTKSKIVLGVGRFVPLKRFEDLIGAFKKCKTKCALYLLGGKPSEAYLDLVGDDKNIYFIDFVLPERVDDYYKMADLFVLPSETDVWGLVLNEAMANGLPVIASDSVVGAKSLIQDNGYIFETYNVDELSKYIDICLEDKTNQKMSNKSLKIIKDFTIEDMVKRQLPIINKFFNI